MSHNNEEKLEAPKHYISPFKLAWPAIRHAIPSYNTTRHRRHLLAWAKELNRAEMIATNVVGDIKENHHLLLPLVT